MEKAKVATIIRVGHGAVSFRVRPDTAEQALLLLLFGYLILRSDAAVTRRQLLDPLAAIPGLKIPRPDRVLESCIRDGEVAVIAVGRVRRYSLTDRGEAKARRAIGDLTGSERSKSDE